MLLTKHEGESYQNQTVFISGQAFLRCSFTACTLVLRETVYYMEGCSFDRCNWQLDVLLPWGSPEALSAVQVVTNLIRQGQENLAAAENAINESGAQRSTSDESSPTPFAP